MRKILPGLSLLMLPLFWSFQFPAEPNWGFFGHRRINRLAVFTLPPEMIQFYKKHIEYITEHAVDPDKRRYATRHEAVRHYMDLDHWGKYPFSDLPRDWTHALAQNCVAHLQMPDGDTLPCLQWKQEGGLPDTVPFWLDKQVIGLSYSDYHRLFCRWVLPQYYEDQWVVPVDSFFQRSHIIPGHWSGGQLLFRDHFSEHGILPYHLLKMQGRLTRAFERRDAKAILRLSAEMGHYVGDAHVPLHTTRNYNGQLTNQIGIHAFWESRLPELFADEQYDFLVGKAQYIEKPQSFFWEMVLESHLLVDSVLQIEKRLSEQFPKDAQYCYEERLGQTLHTQCRPYAEAFHQALKGQVESRMRSSVLSLGSCWYTAWIDAGQPDLLDVKPRELSEAEQMADQEREKAFQRGQIFGRNHGG